jgi:hypothetical protein
MDIYELDSYRLSDAVKFHSELNPALWDGKTMRPEVRKALLKIADDFKTFMGIDDLAIEDITVSGSNAAFSYTPHSDIDLHLLVDFSRLNPDEVYQELFNAKKYQYNDTHDIKIRGYDVELYVQDSNKPVRSLGEYSIVNNDWTRIPVQRRGNLDEKSTQQKYEKLKGLIELATNSDDLAQVTAVTDTLKKYRQAGLDEHGEFGPENLAYKILRTQGYVERLFKHKADLEDARLSLAERKKKKSKKKKFRYGAFGGAFFPGYHYYGQTDAAADGGGDGGGGESVKEDTVNVAKKEIPLDKVVRRFVHFAAKYLKLKQLPKIKLRKGELSHDIHSMGHYVDDHKTVEVETKDRHVMDILRTLAHELTHYRQHQQLGKKMPDSAGRTGSPYENEANAEAGIVMRHFQNKYPEFFASTVSEDGEDVDAQYGNQEPLGPEFPPKMPAGTTKIDVSDTLDWYKLGMTISDLDDAKPEDFNQGPPHTVIVFPSDEFEQPYLKQFKRLGLKAHDIDEAQDNSNQTYLWHGSRQPVKILKSQQALDTGGAPGSNQNAIYATSDPKIAIAMGLTTPGSETAMFPNDPQMVLFSGDVRKGQKVYLHKLPFYGANGKPQFVQGGNPREFHSIPGTAEIKPVEIKAVSVDKYLNLIRSATAADSELRKKFGKNKDVDEGLGRTLATGALAAAAALGSPAQAQDAGRVAYQIGKQIYQPSGIFTRAGAEEEIKGMARDLARDIRTGGSSAKFLGRTILAQPTQGGERVAANGMGSTPEAAFQDALTRAYEDANRRYGPISVGEWRPIDSEKEIQQVGGQYRAAVVLQGPAPRRESIQTPVNREQKDQEDYYRFLRGKVANKRPLTKAEQEFLKTYHLKQQMGSKVAEDASGYIPTKKQARDPRFKTALTVDIKPGQLGKEANKLGLQTDSQGRPDLLMKNLANALKEYKETGVFEAVKPVTPIIPSRAPKTEYPPMVKQKTRVPQDAPRPRPDGTGRIIDFEIKESVDDEAWELVGQPVPEIQAFVKNLGLGNDENSVAKIIPIINSVPITQLSATTIPRLKNLANKPGESAILAALKQISGQPNAAQQYMALMKKRDSAEGRSREYDVSGLVNAIKNGQYESPVLLKLPTGTYVIGGRTRLYAALALAMPINVKILTTNSFRQSVTESEDLLEVKMSPSALEAWANSPEAQGIRAGFEAEMIFRDTKREDDEEEMEPDYDYDERPDSIEHVIDFYSNDDWGYGLSGRGARALRESLYEEFQEWQEEQIGEDWDNNAEDQVRDYMETNVWGDDEEREKRIQDKIDELFPDEDPEPILAAGAGAPRFTRSSDQTEYEQQNELYAKYKEASDAAYEEFETEVISEFESQGEYYDQAREYYYDMKRDEGDYDESDFLRDRYGYMSEIGNSHTLDWPYWTGGGNSSYGSRDWQDIGNSLERATGMDVKVGSGYHSTTRTDDRYIIEPDGSLEPDDYEDAGLEIVSPPMPLPQALEQLQKVIEWGNNTADAYTNSSTGLHMGVSIPYVGGDVDYVKLVLFMGDEYILDKFGRASNTYAASAMGKLRQNMAGARNRGELTEAKLDPLGALELVQKNLIELAARYVQNGVGTSKYTSAHIKDGYIEFRSPGGDYLSMESRGEYDEIKNTMLRFARAMQIAGSPALERREYAKKLYKLISPGAQDDGLKLFSEYAAGTITPEQLKKQWADAVLKKELPNTGKEEWEIYDQTKSGPESVTNTLYADDYDDAYRKAQRMLGGSIPGALDIRKKYPWFDVFDPDGNIVSTLRARDVEQAMDKAKSDHEYWTDDWKVYRRPDNTPEPEKKLSARAQVAKRIKEPKRLDYNYEVIDRKTNQVIDRFYATSTSDAAKVYDTWLKSKNLPTDTENFGYRPTEQAVDNARDSQQLQARIGEPRPAGAVVDTGYYRVSWTERRRGEIIDDALNVDAPNATAAMDRVRSALQAQGREALSIEANPQEPPAWRRAQQDTVPGSTQDRAQQRSQGGFTGAWRVVNRAGNEVYRFSGVGNNQADANRTAQTWLISQGDDLENQGPFDVLPVMG